MTYPTLMEVQHTTHVEDDGSTHVCAVAFFTRGSVTQHGDGIETVRPDWTAVDVRAPWTYESCGTCGAQAGVWCPHGSRQ